MKIRPPRITGAVRVQQLVAVMLLACMFTLIVPGQLMSQTIGRVGTTAAPFLKVGVGSRAMSMGEAYTTQAEDVSGMYWNPAGIASITGLQALFSYYAYFADIAYNAGGVAIPIGSIGTFGAFVGYMDYGSIERTTIESPNGTGEQVSANSIVVGISYGRALTDRFSLGGNVKYVRETIWHASADGFAFDIGVLYKTFFKNIRIGMSISNFGSQMKMDGRDMLVQYNLSSAYPSNLNAHLDTDQFPLPILFRVGISSNITGDFLDVKEHDWIVAVDAVHPNDNKEYLNVGTEVRLYDKLVSLRAGYRELLLADREGGLSFGLGFGVNIEGGRVEIDYANIGFGRFGNQNMFTVMMSF